jgi:ABC-2 type transport system ATP-binding protein
VRTPDLVALQQVVARLGGSAEADGDDVFEVSGVSAEEIGRAAAAQGIVLFELTPHQASLEEAFMEITRGELEYGHEEAVA